MNLRKEIRKTIKEQTDAPQPWYGVAQSIVNHNSNRIIENIEGEIERVLSIDERIELRLLLTDLLNDFMKKCGSKKRK